LFQYNLLKEKHRQPVALLGFLALEAGNYSARA